MTFSKSMFLCISVCIFMSPKVMSSEITRPGAKITEVKVDEEKSCSIKYSYLSNSYYSSWRCPSTNGSALLQLAVAAYLSGVYVNITEITYGGVQGDLLAISLTSD